MDIVFGQLHLSVTRSEIMFSCIILRIGARVVIPVKKTKVKKLI